MRRFFGSLAVALATVWICASAAIAAESGPACPQRIETEQNLRAPVEGFETAKQDLPHWWDAITFYDGRPEEMMSLVYDSDVQMPDGKEVQTWSFDPKSPYWIRCHYSSTSISLVKKLPAVSQCVVTFSNNDKVLELVCR